MAHILSIYYAFLFAPQLVAQAKYDVKKVNENVFILTELWEGNANGNLGVVIGNNQVLLINSMMMNSASSLEKEIQKITDLPITYIINSDSDPYNHHANTYFADKGATIVSHYNMKYSTADHDILFKDSISIPIGNEVVTAYHTPSHTLDHIDVHLEKSNVLFMSDGFKTNWLTYTGPNGLNGVLKGIDMAISLSDENTIIVSGNTSKNPHFYFGNKNRLMTNRAIYTKFAKVVGHLYEKGLSAEEMSLDPKLNEIVKGLEAYPKLKAYLKYQIQELLEVDFNNNFKLTQNELMSYVGVYQLTDAMVIEIVFEDGKLFARQEGAFHFELQPINKGTFDFKGPTSNDYLKFKLSSNGEVESLSTILEKNGWWFNIITQGKYIKVKTN
ncbi:hypothetical protein KXJ69_01575 [Aureisphaera sp. CAU 1614]|uniref:MBL fold metallo-hydrolase n=1 Tax=Halomarinibacterium sedimenti TaxID=2857106 RepID=A0A9X1FLG4_9FLAO|nr:hypothetical protein [Halomarinibacterium sedimenti]MBW2936775.1 hypothetical protein [Halomarinibacterium sedimenti]